MDNDFCYRLIANPRKLKKSNEYIDYDVKLHELLKKKYSDYNISDDIFTKIKNEINEIIINSEINLIVDDIINNIDINTNISLRDGRND